MGRSLDFERNACACTVDAVRTTFNSLTTTLMDDFAYRPYGRAEKAGNGAGGQIATTHDLRGRLSVANPDMPREQRFTYDSNGNLLATRWTHPPSRGTTALMHTMPRTG